MTAHNVTIATGGSLRWAMARFAGRGGRDA
jgi:hypothetical protein